MQKLAHDVAVLILKDFDLAAFIVALTYGLVGVILSLVVGSTKRDVSSIRTPTQHSWIFLLRDNVVRVISNLILVAVFIRFSQQLMGATVTTWLAFGYGLGSDVLSILVQRLIKAWQKRLTKGVDTFIGPDENEKP